MTMTHDYCVTLACAAGVAASLHSFYWAMAYKRLRAATVDHASESRAERGGWFATPADLRLYRAAGIETGGYEGGADHD